MNSNDHDTDLLEQAPEPDVRDAHRFSLIWLIPIVAAVIGLVLAVKTLSERGPTITIDFASAEGLEAGKTRIKYKDVEVGRLETIQLDQDLSQVKVTASMVPEIAPYLTGSTRFWVVRARVAAGEVSGLGTLFSGSHIAMDPGKPGEEVRHFKGLETPPVVSMDTAGSYFKLRAERLGSLNPGAPVYFRQIKVGQVVSYQMPPDGKAVEVRIFIQAPHDERVNQNTRFWNASGMDLKVDTTGVRINTESLMALLDGGIAFETPANFVSGGPVDPQRHVFTLYESYDRIGENIYANRFYFVAVFDGSVRGLSVGAPVEFRGIKVGEVVDVRLEFNAKKASFRIPVLCYAEPERIDILGGAPGNSKEVLARLVKKGLRAQLRTGVLLTGQRYVNLSIHADAKPEELHYGAGYPELPTVPEPVQEITTSLASLLDRLERLPIEQIGNDMRDTVKHAKQLVGSQDLKAAVGALNDTLVQLQLFAAQLNQDIGPEASAVLVQSRKALSAAEKTLNADSPMAYELSQTLKELAKAARAVGALAEVLEQHPQALIFGKGTSP